VASTGSALRAGRHNHAVTPTLLQRANLARLAAGPVALAVGLGALAVARGPGRFTTYAGRSGLAATLTVTAGLALVLAGLVTSLNRPAGRIGDLAVLAGLVWFAPVWAGPRQSRSLHRMSESACLWHLAPGLHQRGRVAPATT
jgi:hypothetical protein